jgi:hypothetical protein
VGGDAEDPATRRAELAGAAAAALGSSVEYLDALG